jgi:hypothetical protein
MIISGMTVRNFIGISSLKEVECSGAVLSADVEQLISLTLYKPSNNAALVYMNSMKQECTTFQEYSSCTFGEKASVRTLLADLSEGETVNIGCNVSALQRLGHTPRFTWSISVYRESKLC